MGIPAPSVQKPINHDCEAFMERIKSFLCVGLFLLSAQAALSAPILRVRVPDTLRQANGATMPVWIAAGTNGPTDRFFETWNNGDGALNLSVSGGVSPWLKPALANTGPCSFDASRQCRRVNVLFDTKTLTQGTYDGMVDVRDSNAVDAPQRVAVRVYVGGNVPERIDLYVRNAQGSAEMALFQTAGGPSPTVTVTPSGNFLSVSSSGLGSVRSLHSHIIQGSFQPGLATGNLEATLKISNSSFAADNRDVPVTLHVGNQPIVQASPKQLSLTTTEGLEFLHSLTQQYVVISNRGAGNLAVAGVEITYGSGDGWLAVEDQGNGLYQVTATAGILTPGLYTASIGFNSNAANSPLTVPVLFEVRAPAGPEAGFEGLVNGASFDLTQKVAPGAIVSLFGVDLAPETASPETTPLPTTAATTKVLINGIEAPLFFVSFQQVNLQVPYEVGEGLATVQVMRGDQSGNQISAPVVSRSPGIFRWGIEEYGIVTNYTQASNYDPNQLTCPLPRNIACPVGYPSAPARTGDVLVIWSTGLGAVTPAVASGAAPSGSLSEVSPRPQVRLLTHTIAIRRVTPMFAGLAPGFVGLFQVNVQMPINLGNNPKLGIQLEFPDGSLSNVVDIAVEP
jgi:uncharacterized protein (TIGR03437 family)